MQQTQPPSEAGQHEASKGRLLYLAAIGCLVATIAGGLNVVPAFRKLYDAFGVDLEPWRSAALSPWCQSGWAVLLGGALVAASRARAARTRDRILASVVWASLGALAFFVFLVLDVRLPLPAINDW